MDRLRHQEHWIAIAFLLGFIGSVLVFLEVASWEPDSTRKEMPDKSPVGRRSDGIGPGGG